MPGAGSEARGGEREPAWRAPSGPGSDAGKASDTDAEAMLGLLAALLADLQVGAPRRLGLHSDLQRDLGLDSLAVVELHDRVERAFGVRIPEEVLATAATVGDWLAAVRRARGQPSAPRPARRPAALGERVGETRPEGAMSLLDALAWHAEEHPDLLGIRLLASDPEAPPEDVSFGALGAEAAAMAVAISELGIDKGERVAIMLPTSRPFFTVFAGILLAGAVPVPIYPPARRAALEEHLARHARLLANAGATLLVTVPEARMAAGVLRAQVPALRLVRTPDELVASGGGAPTPVVSPGDMALLQYTSGSTGDPKGVVLTHGQLLANIQAMGEAAQVSASDVFVSWLPLYHDMGLIGAFLAPLYFGFPLVVSSPLAFLARPASWLQAITSHAGTLSAAPNFAFQMCADRVTDAEVATLDLSTLRLVFNGSEPVNARTLDAFVDRFKPCGFRPEAMCPAYGLAEVGVGVAFSPLGRPPRIDTISRATLRRSGRAVPLAPGDADARPVVSCGRPLPGYELRVCDPHGHELPDRNEGAVSCRGPSATAGYFANPEATRALWRHGWLETGDLGYVADGELFLTGRAKDLVIRAGRNIHPEELEEAVESLDGVRRGGVAVLSVADERLGTERLVAVVETDLRAPGSRADLEAALRRRCSEEVGVPLDEVLLTSAGALPRTASGKLRRAAAREALEAGTLGREPSPFGLQVVRLAAGAAAAVARRLAGELGVWSFSAYAWAVAVALVVPVWLVLQLPSRTSFRWRLVRAAGELLAALTGIRVVAEGAMPAPGRPAVIVANHESFVDGLCLLIALREPAAIVTSTDLGRRALAGRLLRRLGCVFVARGTPAGGREAIETLLGALRGGARLAVFPEGSITRASGLRPFHLGAFAAAAAAGCPVVPVGISGSRGVIRPGTRLVRQGSVRVVAGAPLWPSGPGFDAQVALRSAARGAVAELSGERLQGDRP